VVDRFVEGRTTQPALARLDDTVRDGSGRAILEEAVLDLLSDE